jgi:hypothetical protein
MIFLNILLHGVPLEIISALYIHTYVLGGSYIGEGSYFSPSVLPGFDRDGANSAARLYLEGYDLTSGLQLFLCIYTNHSSSYQMIFYFFK